MEQEANQFAAELLMPTGELSRHLASTSSVQVADIRRMARKFGTSLEMTARRIVESGRYRCAAVFSTGTIIRYAVESDSFRACIHALNSRRLSEDSLAATTTGQIDCSVEVVSKRWLFGVPGVDYPPTVNEQVCWQGSKGAITLLTY